MALFKEIDDNKHIAWIYVNKSTVYAMQGDFIKALNELEKSEEPAEKSGDRQALINGKTNLAAIYYHLGEIEQALEIYLEIAAGRELNENQEESSSKCLTYNNLGILYSELGDAQKAQENFNTAYELAKKINLRSEMANSLIELGKLAYKEDDIVASREYLSQGLELVTAEDNKNLMADASIYFGKISEEEKKYNAAITWCKKALVLALETKNIVQQKDACQCLYKNHRLSGDGSKALEYHDQMLVLEENLNKDETVKKLHQKEFQKTMLQDSIAKAEEASLIQVAHEEEMRHKNQTRNMLLGGGLLLVILAGGLYGRVHYIRKSKAVLQTEKDRSENLLLNILPADIAAELKENGKADARDIDMVSILFTDFKGFTAAIEKLSAQDLVSEINTCFEAFDGIMGKYNIEKIKTIGDAYMAAGGLPVPSDDSVMNTVLASLEMQAFISKRKEELDSRGLPAFEMRVGVHTGPVVAGIVGVKKFQYDIWGDTVNIASRMESSGEVGKVNISQATYNLLKADAQFSFEIRGKIEAKGKGELNMYFVDLEEKA